MGKSADAFRTISEVADWLETPAHVLRFWESKFPQIKPVKRAGGRRYYRPSDMELIGGIKKLLHDDGMTIKGVQKILRDQGVKHVAALSPSIEGIITEEHGDTVEATATRAAAPPADDSATVLPFQRAPDPAPASEDVATAEPRSTPPADDDIDAEPPGDDAPVPEPDMPLSGMSPSAEDTARPAPESTPDPTESTPPPDAAAADTAPATGATTEPPEAPPEDEPPASPADSPTPPAEIGRDAPPKDALPAFLHRGNPTPEPDESEAPEATHAATPAPDTAPRHDPRPETPPVQADVDATDTPEPQPDSARPRPAIIDLPPDPADDSIAAPPGVLAAIAARKGKPLAAEARTGLRTLRDQLAALQARQRDPAGTSAPD